MTTVIGLVALDGYTDSGLAVALDVFRAANALQARTGGHGPFRVEVVSPARSVRSAAGLRMVVPRGLAWLARCDVVLLPGCWVEDDHGVEQWLDRPDVALTVRALQRALDRKACVGASCAGTFALAATGRLDGLRATTTWWLAECFRQRFPAVRLDVDEVLVTEGNRVSAGSVFAMADMALSLVARYAGPSLARQCMRVLLLDPRESQAPYMVLRQMVADEPVVLAAERWVRKHLAEPMAVADLARAAGASQRTLARRLQATLGTTPVAFIHRIRVEAATHLLETTTLSLDQVAGRVGYRDAGTLRRLFRRTVGAAPGSLRHRAGVPG